MAMPTVELRRPTAEESNRRWVDGPGRGHYEGEAFDRGERIIMVDGARWGRTIVTHHGMHGTKHVFLQDNGEVILDDPNARHPQEVAVRSMRKRRWREGEWRPTEEMVLEKARELVEAGKLRDPAVVRREQQEANRLWQEERSAEENQRIADFRAKAMEALQINDPTSEIIDRVVAAMEWAREQ